MVISSRRPRMSGLDIVILNSLCSSESCATLDGDIDGVNKNEEDEESGFSFSILELSSPPLLKLINMPMPAKIQKDSCLCVGRDASHNVFCN